MRDVVHDDGPLVGAAFINVAGIEDGAALDRCRQLLRVEGDLFAHSQLGPSALDLWQQLQQLVVQPVGRASPVAEVAEQILRSVDGTIAWRKRKFSATTSRLLFRRLPAIPLVRRVERTRMNPDRSECEQFGKHLPLAEQVARRAHAKLRRYKPARIAANS